MCILFIYRSSLDSDSDYSLIIATNRDEFFERPSEKMGPWNENPSVIAGRDLRAGGTWLAVSPLNKRIAVLLNLPGSLSVTAPSRGQIAIDYVNSKKSTGEFVDSMKPYFQECNKFLLATVEFGSTDAKVCTYANPTDELTEYQQQCLGFGNSLPETPLKKVEAGKRKMQDICRKYNKINMKEQLVTELVNFLKSEERYLPDPVLEKQHPQFCNELSSIFVVNPNIFGTRTHTLVLVTKTGKMDIIEITLQSPIDTLNPKWERTEFHYDL